MVRYVLVPGYGGSSPGHWQLAWAEELGENAVTISPSSWDKPELDDWVAAVDRAVAQSRGDDRTQIVLIAHSLGCWAVSAWCATSGAGTGESVMLVAPPDPESAAFPRVDAASFLGLRAEPLLRQGVVVLSEDDPYCTPDKARFFAQGWGVEALSVGDRGHLNAASDLGAWDEGRRIRQVLAAS